MITKPMLASSDSLMEPDLYDLEYPVFTTFKEDGIRCLIVINPETKANTEALSRKLLLLPNCHIQDWAEREGLPGMDGEIIVPELDFHGIQSLVMSDVTLPLPISWRLVVFDWHAARTRTYLQRLQIAKAKIDMYGPSHTQLLIPTECRCPDDVMNEFAKATRRNKEGIIIRSDVPYKQGRSTRKEGFMLKMKTFEDAEATIIDFIPEYENNNTPTRDNTGSTKRSSHIRNKKAKQQLGALLVQDGIGRQFRIGSGFDHALKQSIWKQRSDYRGATITYRYQPHGCKPNGLPRCPIFKGIRRD